LHLHTLSKKGAAVVVVVAAVVVVVVVVVVKERTCNYCIQPLFVALKVVVLSYHTHKQSHTHIHTQLLR